MTLTTLANLSVLAAKNWSKDNVPRLGASVAYNTLFALAPILIIVIAMAGSVFGVGTVRSEVIERMSGLIGPQGGAAVRSLLEGASKVGTGTVAVALGSAWFLIAASGAFYELQFALNTVLKVKADPAKSGRWRFLRDRLLSFGMILSIGFLLLVSLTISAALAAVARWAHGAGPDLLWLWNVADVVAGLTIDTALFALIYRFLPDVRLEWRDVWIGATLTSVLFTVGRYVLGAYLGNSQWATAYGVVGAILVLLLWIYYAAQLVLFGAELTKLSAQHHGKKVVPDEHARPAPAEHPGQSQGD